jgi:small subunit ribosomal protein S3Ae
MAEHKPKKKPTTDKWKKKQWYTIIAPAEFEHKEIGETIAIKPETLKGRTLNISARNLTNNIRKQHVQLIFKITEIKGNKAHTETTGHKISESFLKKFIRRRSSKIQVTEETQTADKKTIKTKIFALTHKKISKPKKTEIHNIIKNELKKFTKTQDSKKIIQELIFGEITNNLLKETKKICPMKRIETVKTKITTEK